MMIFSLDYMEQIRPRVIKGHLISGHNSGIEGLTPAQVADIPINLMGNRWEKMIGLAVKYILISSILSTKIY